MIKPRWASRNGSDEVLLTDEEFLKYNHRELIRIATGKDKKRRKWLMDFRDTRDANAEKQSLQDTFEPE